jgi:hypothetical protein
MTMSRTDKDAEITRLRQWLECIHDLMDEEIGARFRTSPNKTEEQMARNSRVYGFLSIPRNLARAALRGDAFVKNANAELTAERKS